MKNNNFKKVMKNVAVVMGLSAIVVFLFILKDGNCNTGSGELESTVAVTRNNEGGPIRRGLTKKASFGDTTTESTEIETEDETTVIKEEETASEEETISEGTIGETAAATVEEAVGALVKSVKEKEEVISKKRVLDVNCIIQLPELPTGCEITSLAIVLNHKGIVTDKCDLADNYLEKGEVGTVLPTEFFLGNPRENDSYGCYSPVIVKTANKYLAAKGSSLMATDLTGSSFNSLLSEIDNGNPVVIWATLNMDEPYYSKTWNIDGKKFTWKSREHCLVLTGYDMETGIVYVADPMKGNVTYNMEVFKDRYEKMYSQAVVIK